MKSEQFSRAAGNRPRLAAMVIMVLCANALAVASIACGNGETPEPPSGRAASPARNLGTGAPPTAAATAMPVTIFTPTTNASAPTMLPNAALPQVSAEAYGNCNGAYTGETRRTRAEWVLKKLTEGIITPERVFQLTIAECGSEPSANRAVQTPQGLRDRFQDRNRPTAPPREAGTGKTGTGKPAPTAPASQGNSTGRHYRVVLDRLAGQPGLQEVLTQKHWVTDGLDRTEASIVSHLTTLSARDARLALLVAGMPFLATAEPGDLSAVMSLAYLSWHSVERVWEHIESPALARGITDGNATGVAMLYGAHVLGRDGGEFLQPGMLRIREKYIRLPNTGTTLITVAALNQAPPEGRLAEIEAALLRMDKYLGHPMPTTHVLVLYHNVHTGDEQGFNFQTHIILREQHIHGGSRADRYLEHEIAHYWWNNSVEWINEGLAEFIPVIAKDGAGHRSSSMFNPPCGIADRIEPLLDLRSEGNTGSPRCEYYLGEGFFRDLRAGMEPEDFRAGVRNLLGIARPPGEDPGRTGRGLGIAEVERAFHGLNPAALDRAMKNWYR